MKRFLSILLILCTFSIPFFADESADEYDDGYVYERNGAGDQILKFSFAGTYPLGFFKTNPQTGELQNQLYFGASFDVGYYRFITNWFAVGADASFTSNWSIGEKLLCTIPVTPGVLFHPTLGNFEFPIYLNAGLGFETWANYKYFPSFAGKASAGCYYRFTDSWSAGIAASGIVIPMIYKDKSLNHVGYFASVSVGGRFHF